MKKPTRFDKQKDHNKFGILNWFKTKHNITFPEEVTVYINMFCEVNEWKRERRDVYVEIAKWNFCQRRFSEFASFVNNKIKNLENLINQKMETATNQSTELTVQLTEDQLKTQESRVAAWGRFGGELYEKEIRLQLLTQKALNKIFIPTKPEEIAKAEAILKEVKSDLNAIVIERKSSTGKFDDVIGRLMSHEKSFPEQLTKLEQAIISLKKIEEEKERKVRAKNDAVAKCREFLVTTKNNADALFKQKILDKVEKVYQHALGKGEISLQMVPDFIDFALTRMTDVDFKIPHPLNTFSEHISIEEYTKIASEILTIKADSYLAQYENDLRAKFADYEVALKNKEQAIASSKQEAEMKAQEIASAKSNANVAAKLNTMAVETAVPITTTKALKKGYEVEMPDTVESMIAIMSAYVANIDICLPKNKGVNKWLSFTPAQAATTLGKCKSEDNSFQPAGILFKETNKL